MFYAPFIRKKFLCASCVLMIAVVNSLMVSLVPLCVGGGGIKCVLFLQNPVGDYSELTFSPPTQLCGSFILDLPPGCVDAKWEPSSVETRQKGV